jgi:hypothetical protein
MERSRPRELSNWESGTLKAIGLGWRCLICVTYRLRWVRERLDVVRIKRKVVIIGDLDHRVNWSA